MRDEVHICEEIIIEINQLKMRNYELELCLQKLTGQIKSFEIDNEMPGLIKTLDIIPSPIVLIDTETRKIKHVNVCASALYDQDIVGYDITDHLSRVNPKKSDGSSFPLYELPAMRSLLYGEKIENEELSFESTLDHPISVLVSSCPIYDASGKMQYVLINFKDVSQLKKIENEQKQLLDEIINQKNRLQIIIDSLPVGILITDYSGKITMINNIALRLCGSFEPFTDSENDIYKTRGYDEAENIFSEKMPIAQALKGMTINDFEVDFERSNGTISTQLVSAAPIKNSNREIIGVIVISQDITDIKNYEKELEWSREQFKSLVSASSYIVYRMNPTWDEIIQLKGKSFIEDRDGPDLKCIGKYIHPDDELYVNERINDAIKNKSIFESEHRVIRSDGTVGWTFTRAVPMIDKKGDIIEWIGMANDISIKKEAEELRIANEALNKSLEIKDEFITIMSHELMTPLTVIDSSLQIINKFYSHDISEKMKIYLKKINQNTRRQMKLANNILDITRINTGKIKIKNEKFDIIALTKSIIDSISAIADNKKINIEFSSTIINSIIFMDMDKYERILLNLLSNAFKYTSNGKSINISLSQESTKICIRISDEGIGIPAHKIKFIFDKFYLVDSSLSRNSEGTGLGLYITKLFVDLVGGEINVESKEGKGSIFTVLFPINSNCEKSAKSEIKEIVLDHLQKSVAVEFSDVYF